jgi:hypothetical protein
MLAKGKIVGQRYDAERGAWLFDVAIESPGDEEPSPLQPTLKQQMILAIVRRAYRRGIPAGVTIADLHRLVAKTETWKAECARRKVELGAPGRDLVASTLRASLIE